MYTIETVINQLTSKEIVLKKISNTLRRIDPSFPEEEQHYLQAVEILKSTLSDITNPCVTEYVDAVEQEICAEMIYIAWLGFQQNIACFQNAVNTMFLKLDYEDSHGVHRMHLLPQVQASQETINAFLKRLREQPVEKRDSIDGITSYMSYYETVGYKLAHYFGFKFADEFLEHVIPGYYRDSATTSKYKRELQEYLKLDLNHLN